MSSIHLNTILCQPSSQNEIEIMRANHCRASTTATLHTHTHIRYTILYEPLHCCHEDVTVTRFFDFVHAPFRIHIPLTLSALALDWALNKEEKEAEETVFVNGYFSFGNGKCTHSCIRLQADFCQNGSTMLHRRHRNCNYLFSGGVVAVMPLRIRQSAKEKRMERQPLIINMWK